MVKKIKRSRSVRQARLEVTARDPRQRPPKRSVNYASYLSPQCIGNLSLYMYFVSKVLVYFCITYDIVSSPMFVDFFTPILVCYWNMTVVVGFARLFVVYLRHSKYWIMCFCLYMMIHSGNVLAYSLLKASHYMTSLCEMFLIIVYGFAMATFLIFCTSRSHSCLRCDYCLRYRPVHNADGIRKDEDVPRIPPEIDPEKSKILYAKCLVLGFCQQAECPRFLNYDLILLTVQYFVSITMTLLAFTWRSARTGVDLEQFVELMKYLRINSVPHQAFFYDVATVFKFLIRNQEVSNVFRNYATSWSFEEVGNNFCILPHACLNE